MERCALNSIFSLPGYGHENIAKWISLSVLWEGPSQTIAPALSNLIFSTARPFQAQGNPKSLQK